MDSSKGNLYNREQSLIQSTLNFVDGFHREYKMRKSKLPYHVNVIDELGAGENAHSRILVRLLGYRKDGQYPVLDNFIDFLKKKYPEFNFSHQIKRPVITSELHRIDVLIKEENYAIIVENKIHNAEDQRAQLIRYIEKVRSFNFIDENIYIVYITRYGGPPDENSISRDVVEKFNERYLELSYRYDILPWLEKVLQTDFVIQDYSLPAAITQYIDHLKGLFELRENEKIMKDELLEFLETQLGLPSEAEDLQEHLEILENKMGQLDQTRKYLDTLLRKKVINYWKNRLKTDFKEKSRDEMLFIKCENINAYPKMGIIHKYKNRGFIIVIGIDTKPYYGIMCDLNSKQTIPEISDWLADEIMELPNKLTGWYGFKYTGYSETYDCFKELAERILRKT